MSDFYFQSLNLSHDDKDSVELCFCIRRETGLFLVITAPCCESLYWIFGNSRNKQDSILRSGCFCFEISLFLFWDLNASVLKSECFCFEIWMLHIWIKFWLTSGLNWQCNWVVNFLCTCFRFNLIGLDKVLHFFN